MGLSFTLAPAQGATHEPSAPAVVIIRGEAIPPGSGHLLAARGVSRAESPMGQYVADTSRRANMGAASPIRPHEIDPVIARLNVSMVSLGRWLRTVRTPSGSQPTVGERPGY